MPRRRHFRLRTERLTLRMLARSDITTFTRYRNDPDVARFQEWTMPYTRDLAHELVDEMELLGAPQPGAWVQLAMDRDGELIGDFAVWIDPTDELAMIGYTVAPRHQGHGYAVEAAAAVIDWLFDRRTIHRIAATIDPRNLASARVLERCGFQYVGTARSAAWSHGEWTDDTRFSLLHHEWQQWKARPTAPPERLRLVEIDASNLEEVCALEITHRQRRFVEGVSKSIAWAAHPPELDGIAVTPWYRAIEADDELAGFVMLALHPHRAPELAELLVDQRHQRRGIATRAVGQVARHLLTWGAGTLEATYVDEEDGPEVFYTRLGFTRSSADAGVGTGGGSVRATARLDDIVRRVDGLTDPSW